MRIIIEIYEEIVKIKGMIDEDNRIGDY